MSEKVPELTNGEFEEYIKDGLVLIDFFADWCMPCLVMAPILEELSDSYEGKIKIGKVNVEENQELAQKYSISSIPNFILFKDGKKVDQFIGSMSAEEFEEKLSSHL